MCAKCRNALECGNYSVHMLMKMIVSWYWMAIAMNNVKNVHWWALSKMCNASVVLCPRYTVWWGRKLFSDRIVVTVANHHVVALQNYTGGEREREREGASRGIPLFPILYMLERTGLGSGNRWNVLRVSSFIAKQWGWLHGVLVTLKASGNTIRTYS